MGREIPGVSVTNYASIFTKPIFKNQSGEWYRDVNYEDSLDLIRENFLSAQKSFVAIGYYLKHIKKNELYKDGGYQNIWECAQKEFGLSDTTASNYMKMNDAYSVNGDTPILDDNYALFNKSQLQEMLALPEEKREEIKPEQTVSEIRKIAKEEKRQKEPSAKEIRQFYDRNVKEMDVEPRSTLKDRLKTAYRNAGGGDSSFDWNGSARGVRINNGEEITWAQLVKLINQYIPQQIEEIKEDDEKECSEEQQLPGQMDFADYPGVMPKKEEEKEINVSDNCPPGIASCIRHEWGLTPEQQETGKKECEKCWHDWKKKEAVLKSAVQKNVEKDTDEYDVKVKCPEAVTGEVDGELEQDASVIVEDIEKKNQCSDYRIKKVPEQTVRLTDDMKLWLFDMAHGNLKENEIIIGFLKHYAIHGLSTEHVVQEIAFHTPYGTEGAAMAKEKLETAIVSFVEKNVN